MILIRNLDIRQTEVITNNFHLYNHTISTQLFKIEDDTTVPDYQQNNNNTLITLSSGPSPGPSAQA